MKNVRKCSKKSSAIRFSDVFDFLPTTFFYFFPKLLRFCFCQILYTFTFFEFIITKTRLYNFDPLKPHFYIVKLGFTGVYIIFLISAQKHRLWVFCEAVLTSTHNICFEQKYEKYLNFSSENFQFYGD